MCKSSNLFSAISCAFQRSSNREAVRTRPSSHRSRHLTNKTSLSRATLEDDDEAKKNSWPICLRWDSTADERRSSSTRSLRSRVDRTKLSQVTRVLESSSSSRDDKYWRKSLVVVSDPKISERRRGGLLGVPFCERIKLIF